MTSAGRSTCAEPALRTVIVDDSALARLMLRDALNGIEGVRVVGNAAEGGAALDVIDAVKPGLIILDVEMPGMNGIELLERMGKRGLQTPVLMCSRLTSEGADVTTAALMQGAYDFVSKPMGANRKENVAWLRSEISERIHPLIWGDADPPETRQVAATIEPKEPTAFCDAEIDVVLIGSSTGGPAALRTLLGGLSGDIKIPVMVVQHIPAGFSQSLARRLDEISALRVVEAGDGDDIVGGTVYIAPGGQHMRIAGSATGAKIQLADSDLVHGCRPAIDVMHQAAVQHFGGRCLAVTLTGMGCDGAEGAKAIRDRGGLVFAQKPESCTVSSMPRQTIRQAGADRVAELTHLSELINQLAVGRH